MVVDLNFMFLHESINSRMMFIWGNSMNFILNLSARHKRSFNHYIIYEENTVEHEVRRNSISHLGHKLKDLSDTFRRPR